MTATSTATSVQGGSQWVQTSPLSFQHTLTGSDARISKVASLQIPTPGVWELTYHARSSFKPTAKRALWIHTWLCRDGVLIDGSQATTGIQGPEAELVQATTGQTTMATFKSGEKVTLHGRYSGEGKAFILSNGEGRTGVVARLVSPLQ
ncbi:hypothetical protein [Streptomyces sp. NPDC054834]